MLVALGMTIVIATGGIDLSVGAVVAISGALGVPADQPSRTIRTPAACSVAIAVALALSMALGLWNGILVAVIGIQPIIATLMLMVAGRGIAQLITGGPDHHDQQPPVQGHRRRLLARAAVRDLHRRRGRTRRSRRSHAARTALGMLIESVGGNAEASRLAGIRSRGLIIARLRLLRPVRRHRRAHDQLERQQRRRQQRRSVDRARRDPRGRDRRHGADRRALLPRRHGVGALVIQTLTTTIYSIGIPPETTLLFKALVVTVVCLLQSPGVPREGLPAAGGGGASRPARPDRRAARRRCAA